MQFFLSASNPFNAASARHQQNLVHYIFRIFFKVKLAQKCWILNVSHNVFDYSMLAFWNLISIKTRYIRIGLFNYFMLSFASENKPK